MIEAIICYLLVAASIWWIWYSQDGRPAAAAVIGLAWLPLLALILLTPPRVLIGEDWLK